jgi:hypothetical protein
MMQIGRKYAMLEGSRGSRATGEKMMKYRALAILLAVPLWACADKPGDSGAARSPATTAIGIAETPLLLASRITLCLATPPLLGPGAIASAAIPFEGAPQEPTGWELFKKGVADACGPPYVAKPEYDLLR